MMDGFSVCIAFIGLAGTGFSSPDPEIHLLLLAPYIHFNGLADGGLAHHAHQSV
jgi:hypothetical protein